jgi:2-amino-4-hydroxy-6-hydroxymethyldihydropteridine diphosphokinase
MAKVGLILGSNLDGKFNYLKGAIALLEENVGCIINSSSIYASPPWGYNSQNEYINQVLIIETNKLPEQLLEKNLLIERVLGRERSENGYTDRTIDIDILFYEDLVIKEGRLILPHPRMHLRKFCLIPIYEVLPNWSHPHLQQPIEDLISICEDKSDLRKVDSI